MIIHKTFAGTTNAFNAKKAFAKREDLRKRLEDFIRNEVNEDDVITITEAAISMLGGIFSVTVWYRG
jgi:hypothetical protein